VNFSLDFLNLLTPWFSTGVLFLLHCLLDLVIGVLHEDSVGFDVSDLLTGVHPDDAFLQHWNLVEGLVQQIRCFVLERAN
jgi:hypothetical protein